MPKKEKIQNEQFYRRLIGKLSSLQDQSSLQKNVLVALNLQSGNHKLTRSQTEMKLNTMLGDEFDEFCALAGSSECINRGGAQASSSDLQGTPTKTATPVPQHTENHSTLQDSPRSSSAPHSRSASWKKAKRPKDLDLGEMRPRTASMPTRNPYRKQCDTLNVPNQSSRSCPKESNGLVRVRSFKTTSKGLVNRGDSFKSKSKSTNSMAGSESSQGSGQITQCADERRASRTSVNSQGSVTATCSNASSVEVEPPYRVLVMGAGGVGKTAIVQQFMTSEYMGAEDTSSLDLDVEKSISVLLDGEESPLVFVDVPTDEDVAQIETDAYVVVYSVADRKSFEKAVDIMYDLRKCLITQRAIILVANKTDIVRTRQVTHEEGKAAAVAYDCKYTETSAVLNHHIDELLVGILSQIRLMNKRIQKARKKGTKCHHKSSDCVSTAAQGLLSKFFKKHVFMSKSCDNLYKL